MKIQNFILAILAVASVTLSISTARAYTTGDLLLGFRDSDSTNDYVVDLGPASNFLGQSLGFSETLSLGNIAGDLSSTGGSGLFGAGWATDANLSWGVAGSLTSNNTLYAGQPEPTLGTLADAPNEASHSAQSTPASNINGAGSYLSFGTASSNATNAFIEANSQTNSWASYMPDYVSSFSAFGYFPSFEANSSSGITNTALDLYSLPYHNGGGSVAGTYDGTFTIDNTGAVTFAVVPEPSTVATVVLGAGLLVVVAARRRRMAQA